jgi:hypothetical protein
MSKSDLTEEIDRAEREALVKAMTGQWTADDDARLASLYEKRRREGGHRRHASR